MSPTAHNKFSYKYIGSTVRCFIQFVPESSFILPVVAVSAIDIFISFNILKFHHDIITHTVCCTVHQIALCTVHCTDTNCPCIFMLSHVLQDIILSTSLIFSMNTYFSLMCSLSQTTHSFALLPNLLS